ncbi:Probable RNA-directed DNA polymerase from transposon BS [Eumeta japonica]|uniref:Probable RNA-directed DNA polymerase from transposon BS n=1 Tax=Eumeta variegata TaxID=151549 RepID=A0A4C1YW28_EUMVA|nr:Probable RNA-directed DNA polymerase from transposon BS [Eumeta japonica]
MSNKQFGFTRGRSTIDAGVELVQHIFGAWEDSRDAISIFCDLSKTFDCVHHETLIGKLRHYGITDRALDLLQLYLSNRVQRVDVNVYINDLPSLVKDAHEIVLFADDTSLLFKVKRQQSTYDDVNNAISKTNDLARSRRRGVDGAGGRGAGGRGRGPRFSADDRIASKQLLVMSAAARESALVKRPPDLGGDLGGDERSRRPSYKPCAGGRGARAAAGGGQIALFARRRKADEPLMTLAVSYPTRSGSLLLLK